MQERREGIYDRIANLMGDRQTIDLLRPVGASDSRDSTSVRNYTDLGGYKHLFNGCFDLKCPDVCFQ